MSELLGERLLLGSQAGHAGQDAGVQGPRPGQGRAGRGSRDGGLLRGHLGHAFACEPSRWTEPHGTFTNTENADGSTCRSRRRLFQPLVHGVGLSVVPAAVLCPPFSAALPSQILRHHRRAALRRGLRKACLTGFQITQVNRCHRTSVMTPAVLNVGDSGGPVATWKPALPPEHRLPGPTSSRAAVQTLLTT